MIIKIVPASRGQTEQFLKACPPGSFLLRSSSVGQMIKVKVPIFVDSESPILCAFTCQIVALSLLDKDKKVQHLLVALYLSKGFGYLASLNSRDPKTNMFQWGHDYMQPKESINKTWFVIETGNFEDIIAAIPNWLKNTFQFTSVFDTTNNFNQFLENANVATNNQSSNSRNLLIPTPGSKKDYNKLQQSGDSMEITPQ